MSKYKIYGSGFLGGMLPPVIKTLLVLNVAIFIAQYFILNIITIGGIPVGDLIIKLFALQPIYTAQFNHLTFSHFWIWQLVTYQFLHGGLWHLFFNMFALWMFGMELENKWGSARFAIYYLLAGIGAGLTQLFISPMFGPTGPTIGASGAIYGILLAFGMTFPNRPIFMFPFFIPIPAKIFVIIFAAIELFSGFSGGDGVAHFAHLGGALTGLLLLKFGDKLGIFKFFEKIIKIPSKSKSTDFFNQNQNTQNQPGNFKINWQRPSNPSSGDYFKPHEEPKTARPTSKPIYFEGEELTQRKIDAILDKITSEGYQSLDEKEKRILTELSKRL